MAPRTFREMPTSSSLLTAYASMCTSVMLFRTMFNQLFPRQLQRYVLNAVHFYFKPKSTKLTLVIDEKDGMTSNHMFDAAETFLCSKINPNSRRLRITKSVKETHINVKFAESESINDSFEGILVTWTYTRQPPQQWSRSGDGKDIDFGSGKTTSSRSYIPEKKHIELKFEKRYRDTIINSYLPWIITRSEELKKQKKIVKLHKLPSLYNESPVNLDHPSTFDTLAMDPDMKQAIIDDLNLFLKRKEFYKKVGKAWKRGYLLYGPPGTGKSSLIAAMANYLKFDVYDLQLVNAGDDSRLKDLMLKTSNRSILVIEDIDCSVKLPDRKGTVSFKSPGAKPGHNPMFSLSGLLNFIDGLWSCCGDERIIIFTTNQKKRLDRALLRPGRMDVHIHMSYLTVGGFQTLAANYLNIHDYHWRFREIHELIKCKKVTPAEVAEELMKSEDVDVVLEGVVKLLKRKKMKEDKNKDEVGDEDEKARDVKRAKIIS